MANPVTRIILSAVDRTKAAFASVKGGLASIGASAMSLSGMLGGIFTGLSVAAFVGQIKKAIDSMDDARKSAQAAGTSVENFTALKFAGDQSGVADMQKSLVALTDSLAAARSGTGPAAEAFKALRIDPTQFTDSSDALDWDTSNGVQPHANPIAKISGDEIQKWNYSDVSGTVTLSKLEADVYFYNALLDNITFDISTTDGAALGDRIKIVVRQKTAVGAKTVSFTSARMKANASNANGSGASATQRAFYEFECIGTNMWQQVSPAAVWYS